MAKGFTFELKGLSQLLNQYNQLPKQLEVEIGAELQDGVNRMVRGAKQDAPGDQGVLRSEISSFKVGPLTINYVSGANYSGYLEFGTRGKVQVPAGLEAFAAEVKAQVGATSLTAKEAIYEWCRRHGIEESAWYPIYRSIMINGINARPFFFKQVTIVSPSIIANIKNILNSLD